MLSGRYAPNTGFEGAGGDGGAKGKSVKVFPSDQPLLPATLKAAGYATVMAGKWHIGFARPMDTPEGRGFDEFLGMPRRRRIYTVSGQTNLFPRHALSDATLSAGYFEGGEDYFDHTLGAACGRHDVHDLWYGLASGGKSRPAVQPARSRTYSTELYSEFIVRHVLANNNSRPLFVYAAFQGVHFPLQVPQRFFDRYNAQGAGAECRWDKQTLSKGGFPSGFTCLPDPQYNSSQEHAAHDCSCNRLIVKAQVSALSEGVGNITAALKKMTMWARTILVFMGDNGGPNDGGHSNAPRRGGKLNFFEGGVRPAAFVASPLLSKRSQGTVFDGMVHEVDWFATFASVAQATLPAKLDGVNFWPTLLDPTTPHRSEVLIADKVVRVGNFKLVAGGSRGADPRNWYSSQLKGCMLGTSGGWMVPSNSSASSCPGDRYTSGGCASCLGCPEDPRTVNAVTSAVDLWLCSDPCTDASPCLWDVVADPNELNEIAKSNPAVVSRMLSRLHALQANFSNGTGGSGELVDNGRFCEVLNSTEVAGFGVFVAPWMPDPAPAAGGRASSTGC